MAWFYLLIGAGIVLFIFSLFRIHGGGGRQPLLSSTEGVGPSRVLRRESLPLLFLSANPFVLERGEYFHFAGRAAYCGAELPEPVFDAGGRLSADNQRIFLRCLFEQGRGELLVTTRRLVYRGEGGMQLMLSLDDIENHAVFAGYLIVGGGGAALDIFRLDDPEQAGALLRLLVRRGAADG